MGVQRLHGVDGLFGDSAVGPGTLSKLSLDPADLTERTPEEIYATAWVRTFQRVFSMIERICPTCSGPVTGWLDVCEDHAEQGLCENCRQEPEVVARFECGVCKEWATTTIGGVARYHLAAVGSHYDHDLLCSGANDLATIKDRLDRAETDWEYVSRDPTEIRVLGLADEMAIVIAADLRVLDVER